MITGDNTICNTTPCSLNSVCERSDYVLRKIINFLPWCSQNSKNRYNSCCCVGVEIKDPDWFKFWIYYSPKVHMNKITVNKEINLKSV